MNHLQTIILQIVKDIDALCQQEGIQYYLYGGSAIGAVRHKGFIPWDDDIDIIMSHDNYQRFMSVAREKLPAGKYFLQEGLIDWPMNYSKLRLRGTHICELEGYAKNSDQDGIFVDIFKFDNTSSHKLMQIWQYICAKYYLCYQLSQRTYESASRGKKILMAAAIPLRLPFLRRFIIGQAERYNNRPDTAYVASYYEPKRFSTCIHLRTTFGTPQRVVFEDTRLPIPEHCHKYLTTVFGDYMKLPPEEEQNQKHIDAVDFGVY